MAVWANHLEVADLQIAGLITLMFLLRHFPGDRDLMVQVVSELNGATLQSPGPTVFTVDEKLVLFLGLFRQSSGCCHFLADRDGSCGCVCGFRPVWRCIRLGEGEAASKRNA